MKIEGVRFNGMTFRETRKILEPFEEQCPIKVIFLCERFPDRTYGTPIHTLVVHVALLFTDYFGLNLAEIHWKKERNNNPQAQIVTLDKFESSYIFIVK